MIFLLSNPFTALGRIAVASALVVLSFGSSLAAEGGLDLDFNPQAGPGLHVWATAFQEDGQLIVAGEFGSYNNVGVSMVTRVNPDGSRDPSFSTRFINGLAIRAIAIQPDGKILIGGDFATVDDPAGNQIPRKNIARLNADGSLDTTFNPGAGFNNVVRAIAIQPDGNILVGGTFDTFNGVSSRPGIARLNANGGIDPSFNPGTGAPASGIGRVTSLVLQPDGKILIGGSFQTYNGIARSCLARVNADGTLDTSFVTGSGLTDPDGIAPEVLAVALDGTKVLVGGVFDFYNGVARRNIARLNENGSIDTSFNPELIPGAQKGPDYGVRALQAQANGKVFAVGTFTNYGGVSRNGVVRLNSDATLDTTFDPGTGATSSAYVSCFAFQDEQFVVIGGRFTVYNGTGRIRLARIQAGPTPPPPAPKRRWVAGEDLKENEKPDRAAETAAVNAKVPQWSYGYRTTVDGISFTPFASADHTNIERSRDAVEGFSGAHGVTVVNTGSEPVIYTAGNVNFKPLRAGQLLIKRTSTTDYPVVRWTAPEAGSYRVLAKWFDINPVFRGGVGHVVVNGVQIFGRQSGGSFIGQEWVDEGNAAMPTQTLQLAAGGVIDFVIGTRTGGANPDSTTDDTAFNAVITRVPAVSFTGVTSPVTVVQGGDVDISVSVDHNLPIQSVHLLVDEKDMDPPTGDTAPPYDFTLTGLAPGSYFVTAVALDSKGAAGISPQLKVIVSKSAASSAAIPRGSRAAAADEPAGKTYTCTQSGPWRDAATWGGAGIPDREDDAIIPAGFEVTNMVAPDSAFPSVWIGNIDLAGKFTTNGGMTVYGKMQASGVIEGATANGFKPPILITAGGSFVNVGGQVFFDNVFFVNQGSSLLGASGGIRSVNCFFSIRDGTVTMLGRRGSNAPLSAQFEKVTLEGISHVNLIGQSYLIGNDGSTLIGNDGSTLIGIDGSTLIGNDGSTLVGLDGASLVGLDSSTLIGIDGSTLIGNDGSTLIGLDGSTLIGNDGSTLIGNDGSTLIGNDGSTVAARAARSGSRAAATPGIVLDGITVSGNLNFVGSVQNDGAVLSPGNSPGRIRVFGNYTQTVDGTLKLDVGGTGPGQFDQLQISGIANFGGNLIINTLDGYTPQPGDNFRAITYASKTGDFDTVTSNAQLTFGGDGMTVEVEEVDEPTPPVVPKITVQATPAKIKEGKSASFVISAPVGSIRPVTVRFAMGGTAKIKADYTLTSNGTVTIPDGSDAVKITLKSKKDKSKEKTEKATMTLLSGVGYELAGSKAATLSITDATK